MYKSSYYCECPIHGSGNKFFPEFETEDEQNKSSSVFGTRAQIWHACPVPPGMVFVPHPKFPKWGIHKKAVRNYLHEY